VLPKWWSTQPNRNPELFANFVEKLFNYSGIEILCSAIFFYCNAPKKLLCDSSEAQP
jgi:hypothetical protein